MLHEATRSPLARARSAAHLARLARAVRAMFPHAPRQEEDRIAAFACVVGSGRIGRTRRAQRLEPHAIRSIVRAHVRQTFTDYLALLARNDKDIARRRVAGQVDALLAVWAGGRSQVSGSGVSACPREELQRRAMRA